MKLLPLRDLHRERILREESRRTRRRLRRDRLWEFKLPDDDEANRALLRGARALRVSTASRVPSFLQLAIPGMEVPPDPDERIDALCALRRLAGYDRSASLCLARPLGARSTRKARRSSVDGLRASRASRRAAGVSSGSSHPPGAARIRGVRQLARRRGRSSTRAGRRTRSGSWPTPSTLARTCEAAVDRRATCVRFTGLQSATSIARPAPPALPGEGTRDRRARRGAPRHRWRHARCRDLLDAGAFWALPVDEAAAAPTPRPPRSPERRPTAVP